MAVQYRVRAGILMQFGISRVHERRLAHGAAILLLGGLVTGCSSDALRFTYEGATDGTFTGSTPNQRQIIAPDQPYPGDPVPAASVDGTHTGSVSQQAVTPENLGAKPVTKTSLAPVPGTAVAAADSKPLVKLDDARPAPKLDETTTGTVAQPQALEGDPVGWSRAGGTQVTAKEGETVYNLSRRFGVPADVLMKMNGIPDAHGLKAGQKVIIPTYVYNSKAPVSAPDNDPKVAGAKSSKGDRLPKEQQGDKVAVLPNSPKLKEGDSAQPSATAAADKPAGDKPATAKAGEDKVAKADAGAYTVASGDTLSKIAKKNGVSVVELKKANGLSDGLLKIGQKLKLPKAGEQVASAKPGVDPVITGATGPAKKAAAEVAGYTPPKAETKIEDADVDTASVAPDSTGIGKMRWPVRGKVISAYGKGSGRSNDGIDIAVPEGTPVKAAENGVVIYAGDGLKDFGNTVLVRHDDGLVTVYGHASELQVKRGEKVKRGQEIARSGMSGTTDAPKLHFEVRKDSAPVDPSTYLE
jgi:murein DD-endopeptidase MepM/ murein hydrolase activator NlpD